MTDHRHDIEKYIKGELTPAERYALERKALSDPFLADALEGAEQLKHEQFLEDVNALKKRITDKNLPAGQARISSWMWPMRIAAGVAIIIASGYIVWSVLDQEPPQDLAFEKNKVEPQPSTTSDSAGVSIPEKLSSPATEQSGAGPSVHDPDIASRSTQPAKSEVKEQPITGELVGKAEPITEVSIAEELETEETKIAEPLALAKPEEKEAEMVAEKTEDIQRAKKLSFADDKRKDQAVDKLDIRPSAAKRQEAGVPSTPITSNIIRGQVTSVEDGSPLPGVNVTIKGTTIGTATDAQGNYQIDIPNTNPSLVFSFIGIQSTEIQVNDKKEMDVQLAADMTQLSEVVVVGYDAQTEESLPPTVDMAHPEIGNRAFKQYLEKNLRYPDLAKTNKVEGRVTVEFTIEPNGTLTNFTILRSIGSGCDEELIRLIREGPKWIPTKKDNIPVQDKVKVRLKFELPK